MKGRKTDYIGLYGNVKLPKAWCNNCGGYSFVQDGELACCGAHIAEDPQRYKRESIPEQRRRIIPQKERRKQLELQNYRCFYCDRGFGSTVYRKGRALKLKIHWDHMVPYSLTQNNSPTNFVAACHVCNGSKSSFVFQTVDEAKLYLLDRWKARGYTDGPEY